MNRTALVSSAIDANEDLHERYRVITWTRRDGITSVSDTMPQSEANDLASLIREANPAWLIVEVEQAQVA